MTQKSADAPVTHGQDSLHDMSTESSAPTVTSSGQVFWAVRDIIFSPGIQTAAKVLGHSRADHDHE